MKECDFNNPADNFNQWRKKWLIPATAIIFMMVIGTVIALLNPSPVKLEIIGYSPVGTNNSFVTGTVTVSANKGNPSDYAVTIAIVSPTDGKWYAPKPTLANPTAPVTPTDRESVGNFTCVFSIGSTDAFASELYVYIVPRDFMPDEDIERTKKAAVVSQLVNR